MINESGLATARDIALNNILRYQVQGTGLAVVLIAALADWASFGSQ